jgi:hypothetical protein
MKLIGPKSISTGLSYLFLLLFIFLAVNSIYMTFTFGVGYYNWTYSHNLLPNIVEVAKMPQNVSPEFQVYFRFKYPFSNVQMMMGFFTFKTFVFHTFQNIFFSLFFFFAYKVFKELSNQKLFTKKIIRQLTIFSIINLLYAPLYFFIWIYIFNASIESSMVITSFAFLFLGIIMYFIKAFFKKGYQLQSENDLTI